MLSVFIYYNYLFFNIFIFTSLFPTRSCPLHNLNIDNPCNSRFQNTTLQKYIKSGLEKCWFLADGMSGQVHRPKGYHFISFGEFKSLQGFRILNPE